MLEPCCSLCRNAEMKLSELNVKEKIAPSKVEIARLINVHGRYQRPNGYIQVKIRTGRINEAWRAFRIMLYIYLSSSLLPYFPIKALETKKVYTITVVKDLTAQWNNSRQYQLHPLLFLSSFSKNKYINRLINFMMNWVIKRWGDLLTWSWVCAKFHVHIFLTIVTLFWCSVLYKNTKQHRFYVFFKKQNSVLVFCFV